MSTKLPALSLAAIPGRRVKTIELAKEIESRGYSGIYCPSLGDCVALCEAIALATENIPFGTSVAPIYYRQVDDYAATAAFIHEVSAGRFSFGIGVSHAPVLDRRGISPGRPLGDIRNFVEGLRAAQRVGELPPIVLAALRPKMIALAAEIAAGLVFANVVRRHMPASLAALPESVSSDKQFYIGNMIPTCVHEDIDRARAVNRKTLSSYVLLPNYRNYWKDAGFESEMAAVEKCIAEGKLDAVGECLSDAWLDETTIAGPPARVRDEVEKWYAAGVTTPILVPSSANGGQLVAFEELFAVFA